MRIAIVKRRCSLKRGGSERYCVNLVRSLTSRGHDVTVIGESIDDELREEIEFRPVRVDRFSSPRVNRSFAENAGRAAAEGRFDLVYGLGRAFGLDVVRVTERLQSHWIRVHYRHPMSRLLQRWNPRHRTLIDLERTIYQSSSVRRIVTQSQLDRRLVIEHYQIPEEKVCIVYNGVDTATFHLGVRSTRDEVRAEWSIDDKPLLVFASMDFAGKGLGSILHALARVVAHDPVLLVLGTGPIRKFQRVADRLGIGERVIFAGRRSEIERYYGAADLFLLPTTYEPFPNVNLEAMACGLPVLTTDTAGGADIVSPGENGYLVSGVSAVEEIADALENHLRLSSEEKKLMSDHCWNTAQSMTLDVHMENTLAVFEDVLRDKFRV